jgi:hypothetical protein
MINGIDISYKVYGLEVVSEVRMHRKKSKQLVIIHDEAATWMRNWKSESD